MNLPIIRYVNYCATQLTTVEPHSNREEEATVKTKFENTNWLKPQKGLVPLSTSRKFYMINHFIFLGSRIDKMGCYLEELKRIMLGMNAMMKLYNIMNDNGISLKTKKKIVEALEFPVSLRKEEGKIIEALEMWTWRKLLRMPWIFKKGQIFQS
ncbi:hypothetical protein LAZ67_23001177 [Cordylochernes scorpioides]|uniref:Uncharacterized protein n=1 Tax=Cordylochernes scorpioides TaxID=51811 RepID=A0ABY6LQJ1_9ARAC|nr:hypothetical protein LAZ67_23001177 [Cordylochernes scorpioides]